MYESSKNIRMELSAPGRFAPQMMPPAVFFLILYRLTRSSLGRSYLPPSLRSLNDGFVYTQDTAHAGAAAVEDAIDTTDRHWQRIYS